MRLIIHAPNVHQGGGQALLTALLRNVGERFDVMAVVDSRFNLPPATAARVNALRISPTLWDRLRAERKLMSLATAEATILCFGNLPPLFNCRGRILLFLQNRYLTGGLGASGFPWRTRLRILAERAWLRWRIGKVHQVVVQSPSMEREVARAFGVRSRVLAFVPEAAGSRLSVPTAGLDEGKRFDFLYVASGEPHKNHRALLEAWALLAGQGIRPTLRITLDAGNCPELLGWIQRHVVAHGLKVENVGQMSPEGVDLLYRSAGALIYPSLGESLGLPLIEARAHGLPILAPEKDYVRDVVEPVQTFDPESPVSIARAVRRFLGAEEDLTELVSARKFLAEIESM
jgi:glycosyltransferase involved in cell wall biosynthesis